MKKLMIIAAGVLLTAGVAALTASGLSEEPTSKASCNSKASGDNCPPGCCKLPCCSTECCDSGK